MQDDIKALHLVLRGGPSLATIRQGRRDEGFRDLGLEAAVDPTRVPKGLKLINSTPGCTSSPCDLCIKRASGGPDTAQVHEVIYKLHVSPSEPDGGGQGGRPRERMENHALSLSNVDHEAPFLSCVLEPGEEVREPGLRPGHKGRVISIQEVRDGEGTDLTRVTGMRRAGQSAIELNAHLVPIRVGDLGRDGLPDNSVNEGAEEQRREGTALANP